MRSSHLGGTLSGSPRQPVCELRCYALADRPSAGLSDLAALGLALTVKPGARLPMRKIRDVLRLTAAGMKPQRQSLTFTKPLLGPGTSICNNVRRVGSSFPPRQCCQTGLLLGLREISLVASLRASRTVLFGAVGIRRPPLWSDNRWRTWFEVARCLSAFLHG